MTNLRTAAAALAATIGLGLSQLTGAAIAQDYPTKPVRILVPYAPGGATDIIARFLSESMHKSFNQPILVENKPGAFGIIATEEVAKAPADGYTLMVGNVTSNVITPLLHKKKMSIDYDKTVVPVARVAELPAILTAATSDFPVKTYKELIAYAKKNPGKVRYGSVGIGSFPQFDMIELIKATGTDMEHIPIKAGASGALQALMTGDVQVAFMNVATTAPQVKAGRVTALSVVADKRLPDFPEVPTMAEIGLPDVGTIQWIGLFATAGTPEPVLEKLNKAVEEMLAADSVKASFAKSVIFAKPTKSLAEAKTWIAGEKAHWTKIIETSGVDPDKAE